MFDVGSSLNPGLGITLRPKSSDYLGLIVICVLGALFACHISGGELSFFSQTARVLIPTVCLLLMALSLVSRFAQSLSVSASLSSVPLAFRDLLYGLTWPAAFAAGWYTAAASATPPWCAMLTCWAAAAFGRSASRLTRMKSDAPATANRNNQVAVCFWLYAVLFAAFTIVLVVQMESGLVDGEYQNGTRIVLTSDSSEHVVQSLSEESRERAAQLLEQIACDPNDAVAHLRLGEIFWMEGRGARARPLLERAVRLDRQLDHAHYMLGEIYEAQGLPGRAIRQLRLLLQNSPSHLPPLLKIGALQGQAGHHRAACRTFLNVLSVDPTSAYAYLQLGVNSTWLERMPDAKAYFAHYREFTTDPVPEWEPWGVETDASTWSQLRASLAPHFWKIIIPVFVWLIYLAILVLCRRKRWAHATWHSDFKLYTGIYALALGLLFFAHYVRISVDPALNGEELEFAFRNIIYFAECVQPDAYSTTFSSSLFYWIGSHLIPMSIHYGRVWRILFLAGVPVLIAMLVRQLWPGASRFSSVSAALLFMFLAPVTWLSILSVDYCIDCLFGFVLFLLVVRTRWSAPIKSLLWRLLLMAALSTWTIHLYGSIAVLFPVLVLYIPWRIVRTRNLGREPRLARLAIAGVAAGLTTGLIFWPRWYYETQPLVMFGGPRKGTFAPESLVHNVAVILNDLFLETRSYMLEADMQMPAFPVAHTGVTVALLAVVGCCACMRARIAPAAALAAVGLLSFGLGVTVYENPGLRRCIPMVIALSVFAGVGTEVVCRQLNSSGSRLSCCLLVALGMVSAWWAVGEAGTKTEGWPFLIIAGIAWLLWGLIAMFPRIKPWSARTGVAAMVVSAGFCFFTGYAQMRQYFDPWLQLPFTYLPGRNYEETIEELAIKLQQKRLSFSDSQYAPATFMLWWVLADRRGSPYMAPAYHGDWDTRIPRLPFVSPADRYDADPELRLSP
jgi:tetratricopeptide (TPR) repeat protein